MTIVLLVIGIAIGAALTGLGCALWFVNSFKDFMG